MYVIENGGFAIITYVNMALMPYFRTNNAARHRNPVWVWIEDSETLIFFDEVQGCPRL